MAIILIAIFAILFIYLVRWNGNSGLNYRQTINSDGRGYYQYFQALLSGDIKQQTANNTYLLKLENGKVINKYFAGTAVLESPFILSTYIISRINNKEIDFYSEYFQKTISISALFYLLLGLIAIRKLLLSYNIKEYIIAFSIFAMFFATNLSYYALIEPSMSHTYSFAFISMFYWAFREFILLPSKKHLFLTSFFLGIILLIRPINLIILLAAPLLYNSKYQFDNTVKYILKHIIPSIFAVLIITLIVFIQSVLWKLQTGQFIIWSYHNEGFYFDNPHFFDFLFSFRKGWFIYTPIALLSLIISVIAFRKNMLKLASSIIFFSFLVYTLSSWWSWYYGDSYGSRVMIDFVGILILLFAISLNKLNLLLQRISVIIAAIFILLSVFQSYQYYNQIMSHFDMNAEKYAYIFGKFGEEYRNVLGGNNDIMPYHKKPPVIIENKVLIPIKTDNNWQLKNAINISEKQNNKQHNWYNYNDFSFSIDAEKIMNYKSSYLEFGITSSILSGDMSQVYWEITYRNATDYIYATLRIKIHDVPFEKEKYRSDNYALSLPTPNSTTDKIYFTITNKTNAMFYIKELNWKLSGLVVD